MAYGKIKADAIIYDNSGSDVEKTIASLAAAAPSANPAFTGTPTAPTAAQGTNTTQIATTAFVNAEIAADTAAKAPLADPTFTGVPAAPTASAGTNTTQIATTAFVNAEIAADLTTAIGSTVQPFSSATAKTDTGQTFVPTQTFTAATVHNGGIDSNGNVDVAGSFNIDGAYKQVAEAVSALDINLSTGNYFTKTINGNSTFTFSNPPASGTVGSFTLELTHTSGTVAWPSSVKFPKDEAPELSTGKTHLFVFVTDDGGSRYRGAFLADYTN